MKDQLHVTNPPPKPLMIWDGDCHFCRRWIERWREQTGDEVDYEPSQKIAARFPEIGPSEFQEAVILVLPNGQAYRAAEAVFRSLAIGGRRWPLELYEKNPAFAHISETAYKIISRHRKIASGMTQLLWGSDVRHPTYLTTRRIFLRALGLTYLVAFVSLWIQIDGLVGERGILPARNFFSALWPEYGTRAILALPSLCWLNSSNAMLHALCALGVIASLVLMTGLVPIGTLIICFVSYLSLSVAGQTFLSFQWDILLLEAGFLAIFFAPWQWRMVRERDAPVSRVALFLLKFLLFKLIFMSGVVKLTSADDCWWNLTALDYHYWSQPLPTIFAWFADKGPDAFKKFSVAFCLVVEIIVPFFIWAPRRLRLIAATLLIGLQIAIAVTGNYCFFNLLTIALCLLLVDDASLKRVEGRAPASPASQELRPPFRGEARSFCTAIPPQIANLAAIIVLIITLPLNLWLNYTAIRPNAEWPRPLLMLYGRIEPFRIVNSYGLFRVMTKERPDIQVEGSADGIDWVAYDFKWKPGDVNRPPRWCAPHQPRLDWQMWFAALGGRRQEAWFGNFMFRLLENEPSVTRLLARNPFPDKPPLYVRATLFKYQFTTSEQHRANGAWWTRREVGEYFPEISLRR